MHRPQQRRSQHHQKQTAINASLALHCKVRYCFIVVTKFTLLARFNVPPAVSPKKKVSRKITLVHYLFIFFTLLAPFNSTSKACAKITQSSLTAASTANNRLPSIHDLLLFQRSDNVRSTDCSQCDRY